MVQPTDVIAHANDLSERLTGSSLPLTLARLYSHRTRVAEGRDGLASWGPSEGWQRLSDAERLVEAGLIRREQAQADWLRDLLRAGEILEWVDDTRSAEEVPARTLAAACYQLAGYPARASALLRPPGPGLSPIVGALLGSDFVSLQAECRAWWSRAMAGSASNTSPDLTESAITELVRAMGVIAAWFRWGEDERVPQAVRKLESLGRSMISSVNGYDWLLARLSSIAADRLVETALRPQLENLADNLGPSGRLAMERYARVAFRTGASLSWPSQAQAIERISRRESFAMCAPTGSGKTRIAELCILDALFREETQSVESPSPVALYLVPSRALAAEVEAKLSLVARDVGNEQVNVTSLYGGADWGPSDSLLDLAQRTVVILTPEKAEALLRFLGPWFSQRISLLIVDEAHGVRPTTDSPQASYESRSLRLESLVSRLAAAAGEDLRIVALSAVARGAEAALAGWSARMRDAAPSTASYRSTRQLVGRLECIRGGATRIRYDLLDGQRLRVADQDPNETPYVPDPFPRCPQFADFASEGEPEKWLRPYVLWAAMHSAARGRDERRHSVLIAVPQQPGAMATSFLELLETHWAGEELPDFFEPPDDPALADKFDTCKRVCADYFGPDSRECRLLGHGIAVHHGKMPGPMSRLIVELVQARIVNIVVATSTLSEGVNLPFELVLITSLVRHPGLIERAEFENLIGRAGRPGTSVEGRALVVTNPRSAKRLQRRTRAQYASIIGQIASSAPPTSEPSSGGPLGRLLAEIEDLWARSTEADSLDGLRNWLETTVCNWDAIDEADSTTRRLFECLDTLDGHLLSAIEELESELTAPASEAELEARLKELWRCSYSAYAEAETDALEGYLTTRGGAAHSVIYPSRSQRQQIYRSGLVPRLGQKLVATLAELRDALARSSEYAGWNTSERVQYVRDLVDRWGGVDGFALSTPPKGVEWHEILVWWLDPETAPRRPRAPSVSNWYSYASQNFVYRFNWGLGAALGLLLPEETSTGSTLDRWSDSGLPWAAFWLKDMMTWGVTDPVTAYALWRRVAVTRPEAASIAGDYRDQVETLSDDSFDPRVIQAWFDEFAPTGRSENEPRARRVYRAEPSADFTRTREVWRVIPIQLRQDIAWLDVSGTEIARSSGAQAQNLADPDSWDYVFRTEPGEVVATPYL